MFMQKGDLKLCSTAIINREVHLLKNLLRIELSTSTRGCRKLGVSYEKNVVYDIALLCCNNKLR